MGRGEGSTWGTRGALVFPGHRRGSLRSSQTWQGFFFPLKFRLFPELCLVEPLVTDQASTLIEEVLGNFAVPFPSPVIKGVFLLPKYPQTDGQGLQTRQMSRSVSCASPARPWLPVWSQLRITGKLQL